jgi:hypothetical protein
MRDFFRSFLIFFSLLFLSAAAQAQTTYDWTGAVSTDWSNPANWESTTNSVTTNPATTYPGPADQARIGVLTMTNTSNFPVISAGGATSVGSIVWGTENYLNVSLVVNTTFTVNGDINNTSAVAGNGTASAYTFNISGTGTMNVTGNLNIGYDDGFSTSSPGNNNSFSFNSSLNKLNIQGNVYLNIFQGDTKHRGFVPALNITGGTFATTSIQSVLTNSTTVNALLTADLTVGNSSGTPTATLQLTGASALPSFSPYVTNTITFNNPGATVEYSGASQTVYTDNAVANLSNTISYYNIKFSGSGVKTALSGNLNVAGDFTNTMANDACNCNAVSLSAPTVNFNGTTQNLYGGGGNGTTFYTVNCSNSGTKTMQSGSFNLASTGVLTMSGSGTTLAAGTKLFTLLSDASSSAAIAAIPSGCLISGTVNVQRYLTGNNSSTYRNYRLLSSPVNMTSTTSSTSNYISLAYLNGNTTIGSTTYYGAFTGGTGGVAGGFTVYNKNPTIYFYNESLPISNTTFTSGKHVGVTKITSTTVDLSNGSTGKSIPVGNGYILFYVGPDTRTDGSPSTPPGNSTPTASGYLNQQNVTVNLWYAPTSGSSGQLSYTSTLPGPGYNMVGNPYACTINLSQVITDNSTAINAIYTLNTYGGSSQTYTAYTANGTSAPSLGYAVSGSGFIVHATGTGKSLVFKESEKVASQSLSGVLMGKPQAEDLLSGFYMKLEHDSIKYNYCGIYFRNDWSDKFEGDDANGMDGDAVDIASLSSDGVKASVNHLSALSYSKNSRIKLFVTARLDGTYNLKIEGIRNIDTLYDIYLIDHLKNDSVNIRKTGVYAFDISRQDTTTYGSNRFELSVRLRPLPAYQLLSINAVKVSNGIQITWKTSNESNYTNFVLQKQNSNDTSFNQIYSIRSDGSGSYSFVDRHITAANNVYRLQQQAADGTITYSGNVSVLVDFATLKAVVVYPNPASADIHVALNKPGEFSGYKSNIYSSTGALIQSKTTNDNNWSHNISQLLPGSYIIQVFDSKNHFVGQDKFLKN